MFIIVHDYVHRAWLLDLRIMTAGQALKDEHKGILLKVVPQRESRMLVLQWAIPAQQPHSKSMPSALLSHLLGWGFHYCQQSLLCAQVLLLIDSGWGCDNLTSIVMTHRHRRVSTFGAVDTFVICIYSWVICELPAWWCLQLNISASFAKDVSRLDGVAGYVIRDIISRRSWKWITFKSLYSETLSWWMVSFVFRNSLPRI